MRDAASRLSGPGPLLTKSATRRLIGS